MRMSIAGYTLIEILIAVFLLGVLTVGIAGIAVVGTRSSFESERQNVAQAIANEEMEGIRAIAYDDVGYSDATGVEPDGVLARTQTVSRNQQDYMVETSVELIDDPDNGTLDPGDLIEPNADYKKVRVRASWDVVGGFTREIIAVSYIAHGAASSQCTPGAVGVCPGVTTPELSGTCIANVDCPSSGICPPTFASDPYCPTNAQYCSECYTDADCSGDSICDTGSNTCVVTPGACHSNGDCFVAGEICFNYSCTAPCLSDLECGVGQVCNTSKQICTTQCTSNSCSCPIGQSCNTGTFLCE